MTREQGTGNREQGNFTFRYLCRFFSVHLLSFVGWVEEQNPTLTAYYRV
ncbi:MAG: hypothetical protein ACK6A9_05560 [Dolichospermum sp.]